MISPTNISKTFLEKQFYLTGKCASHVLRIQQRSVEFERRLGNSCERVERMYRRKLYRVYFLGIRDIRYLSRTSFQKHVHVKVILEVVMQLDNIHMIQLFVDHNLTCNLQGIDHYYNVHSWPSVKF